jgi:large subunit ribosomal protein L1
MFPSKNAKPLLLAPGWRINNISETPAFMNTGMATPSPFLAQLSRICLFSGRQPILRLPATFLGTTTQVRYGSSKQRILSKAEKAGLVKKPATGNTMKSKKKEDSKKKRKPRTTYRQYNLKDTDQYSLCEAMRYVRSHQQVTSSNGP